MAQEKEYIHIDYSVNDNPPHHKFYEVQVRSEKNSFDIFTRHGRVGTQGRTLFIDSFSDLNTAMSHVNYIVNRKLQRGYHRTKKKTSSKLLPASEQKVSPKDNKMLRFEGLLDE